jgi:hypothetical protein
MWNTGSLHLLQAELKNTGSKENQFLTAGSIFSIIASRGSV